MTSAQSAAPSSTGVANAASGASYWDHPGQATSTTQATPTAPDDTNPTAHLIGRTSIALIAVIGVILLCAWALKRLGMGGAARVGRNLPIVASRSLGQRERIVVVEIEEEWLVLGVTSQQINTLHRLPAPADREPPATRGDPVSASQRFGQILSENIERLTGRRAS